MRSHHSRRGPESECSLCVQPARFEEAPSSGHGHHLSATPNSLTIMELVKALHEVAAVRAADPLRPVTFVVPTRLAALAMRRELARLTPHAAVRFETLPRLAELVGSGSLAAAGRLPLARPIGDYAAGVVARDSGGTLAQVAGLPGYARVLRRHFQRLRRGGIRSSGELDVPADNETTREFLRAYDAFRALTHEFYDDEDLFDAGAAAIAAGQAGVAAELGDIYLVAPAVRTAGGDSLVHALAGGSNIVQLDDDPVRISPSFILMPDPSSEAESVARSVLQMIEHGAGMHEIAVFHGADSSYPALLASAFRRADVPAVRFPGQPLNETPAGRAVLALIELPVQDYSRVAVLDFFALAQSHPSLPGGGADVPVRATTWERISREAGVTHGAARWGEALAAAAADLRDRASNVDDDAWRERIESDAETADALSGLMQTLIGRLEPLRSEQPAARFVARLRAVVDDYVRTDSTGFVEVVEEIDQLGTVAAIGGALNLETFITAFDANLRAAAIREGGLGDGILVADFRAAAGLRYPHVVVCGAHEGAFPPGVGIAPVVDENWWSAARARHPFVEDANARLERERAAALRCLATATESLTVTLSVTASAGTRERYPSPVVAEVASAALGRRVTPTDIRNSVYPETVRGRSPLAAAAVGPALDAFESELREAIAARQAGAWAPPTGHRLALPVELRRMRRAPRLNRWDGLVQLDVPLLPADRQLSATSVEAYGTCGFRFFLRSILRLQALDEPEERQTMDPAMRGTIVHKALDRFFRRNQERGRPAPGESWNDADQAELLAILDEQIARASARGQAGLPIFHAHELATLHADMERFLKEDSLHRLTARAMPAAFEWEFDGVAIGGRRFRGAADRVDRSLDGTRAWIIDYKTGRSEGYTAEPRDPFNGGEQLQLGIYAAALASMEDVEVTGRYWFITQRGEFAAVEYTHSPENAGRLAEVVRAIEAGVSGGVFPAVPGEEDQRGGFENCAYCDFDRICSRRRLAEFTNRAGDDSLGPWALVEAAARGTADA